ncbi:MAG: DUF1232 domain-containing protein [Aggregatilineales bacterium]
MTDQDKGKKNLGPRPWGSEPIRGLDYSYLDIDEPPVVDPTPVMPEVHEFNAAQAQDFYQRIRGKVVSWAEGAGAGKEITKYVLLVPDIVALMVRLMGDSRVSGTLKAEIAAASAYIILPVDLMPEAVMGPAGLIDDAIIGMIALNRVFKAMGQAGADILRQYWDGDEDVLKVMQELLDRADRFVTGPVWSGIKKFMSVAADELKSVAADVAQSARTSQTPKQLSSGPIIEGSYRPILPAGQQGPSGPDSNDDDQWIIPPNERPNRP